MNKIWVITIDETRRLTTERRELSELEQADLNAKLAFLVEHLKEHPQVSIEYFVPDERKTGGAYQAIAGSVKKYLSAGTNHCPVQRRDDSFRQYYRNSRSNI